MQENFVTGLEKEICQMKLKKFNKLKQEGSVIDYQVKFEELTALLRMS